VPIRQGPAPAGLDGVESQVGAIAGNGYQHRFPYLTGNVVLWPRPFVLFAGPRISDDQLALLRRAADAAQGATLATIRDGENELLSAICREGLRVVSASSEDISAMRRAVSRVYAQLTRDTDAARAVAKIAQLRGDARPDAVGCPTATPQSTGAIEGDYTTRIGPRDVAREVKRIPRRELDEAGLGDSDRRRLEASRFTLTLHHGNFVLYEHDADGRTGPALEGTYSLYRDRIVVTGTNGDILRGRWSFDGTRLRLSEFTPGGAYRIVWASEPWVRTSR
jgi:hypothetical protein